MRKLIRGIRNGTWSLANCGRSGGICAKCAWPNAAQWLCAGKLREKPSPPPLPESRVGGADYLSFDKTSSISSFGTRPRGSVTRGALAPNARLRAAIVSRTPQKPGADAAHHAHEAPARMGCARLLKRVFDIDLEHCPQCAGDLKIIAAIEEPAVIVKILTHLVLPPRALPGGPILKTRSALQQR